MYIIDIMYIIDYNYYNGGVSIYGQKYKNKNDG